MKRFIAVFLVIFAVAAAITLFVAHRHKNEMTAAQQYGGFLRSANIGSTDVKTDEKQLTIEIDDFLFRTTTATIPIGTTVTWINTGKVRHNVVSDRSSPEKGLGSKLLANGDSYSYTFEKPGDYYYLCTPHPTQMRGVVTVQ